MTTYTIGIDIGGTCTDCVVVDSSGRFELAKTFSTPPQFSKGIANGLSALATAMGQDLDGLLSATTLFLHSTTVAENALVDGTTARAGLITSSGFEDTLAAMRGGYGRWSGLTETEKRDPLRTDKPPALIARSLIQGIEERVDARGELLRSPDDDEIERAVEALLGAGAESIAVCLLWSFLAPETEDRIASVVQRLRPEAFVTTSHEIAPVLGEYERTATTALNAILGPVVADYLSRLKQDLDAHGFVGTLLVMQNYGGLLPLNEAAGRPVGMIESGPVGGLLGAKHVGELLGTRDMIVADMGGTTFKVGVVREGSTEYEPESRVLRYHFATPKLDIASLGLAGGSIISVDPSTGEPSIGPRSAGSFPGPVCYGNGGEEPTVTDVDAILGYLHLDYFLGGDKELHVDAARQAFEQKVAQPLGLSVEEAAPRIYRLANSLIYDMLHKTTIQRGLDPRGFSLVSIGGTAGMHVSSYATALGVDRVIIPSTASVHSAAGLLHSDVVHEDQLTKPMRFPVEADDIDGIFAQLATRVGHQLANDDFPPDATELIRSIDMRYARQTNIVTVPVEGSSTFDTSVLEKSVDLFEDLYRNRYGRESGFRDAGIELITFRVRGIGRMKKPSLRPHLAIDQEAGDALLERRWAWVDDRNGFEEIDGYRFDRLRPGNVIPGPAIVWTPITTVVLRAADVARMDDHSNLLLERASLTETDATKEGAP